MNDAEQSLLALASRLHEGLTDMIAGGRLTEDMIPDDFLWLQTRMAEMSTLWQQVERPMAGLI